MSRALISPRTQADVLPDWGERSALVGRQRVGRERRRRRAVARVRRVLASLVLVGVALAIMAAGLRWLTTAPYFAVRQIEVRGASRVPQARILDAAGVVLGANLWTLDTRAVQVRLAAIPEIARADVVRAFPDRVTIAVEERRPFTLVHAARLHWLDENGRLLGEESRAVVPELPVISGLTETELAAMRTTPGPKARAAIALIRALLRSGSRLAAEISEIDMSRAEGPVLYTVDGIEVRLGGEDWEERLARLEGVLAQVATQDVSGVDLRFRDQVVLTRTAAR